MPAAHRRPPADDAPALTVGQLARRSGLTVRTLHHFDQIGLLCPAARSDAGYRLYGRDDVARLHGILALRHLGLPLQQIGPLLDGGGDALPQVLARQVRALDVQIAEATALRGRLALLLDRLAAGTAPSTADWLDSLAQLAVYARHFQPDEIRRIVAQWQAVRGEWPPLLAAVRAAMAAGVSPTDPQVQPLAHQWMALVHHALGGDFDLIARWGHMVLGDAQWQPLRAPGAPDAGPDRAMVRYIDQATTPRLAAWQRHFTLAELSRFRFVPAADWQALADAAVPLLATGVPPGAPAAAALAKRWRGLWARQAGDDPALQTRLATALAAEPLLRAGAPLPAPVRDWLIAADAVVPAGAAEPGGPVSPSTSPTRTAPVRRRPAARSATPSRRTSPG